MIPTILALLMAGAPAKCDLGIAVSEGRTSVTSNYCLNLAQNSLVESRPMSGPASTPIDIYRIEGDRLFRRDANITNAVEILAQTRIGNTDIIVVRNEYNSFSSPLRALAAVAGHPVQVSEVIVLSFQDRRVIGRWRVARRASSYQWRAVLQTAGTK